MGFKSFADLIHRPLLVDMTIEDGIRMKVIYGSKEGFHAVDLESGHVYDIYCPNHSQGPIVPHTIVTLPHSRGTQLLLCYDNEGVYANTLGKLVKNYVLQWGETPTSVAYIGTGQIMGWGNKAIEIRSVDTGHLDGVFMHKKAQKLKFLCERNDKVTCFFFFFFLYFLSLCLLCLPPGTTVTLIFSPLLSSPPGLLLLCEGWIFVPNILHDPE